MELGVYLSFCLASFLMALMPGPDNIYVLTESLAKGARNGLWIAFGLNSGVVVHTLAAATGLSIILKQSEIAFQLISYLGALYLMYLAYQAYRDSSTLDTSVNQTNGKREGAWKLYRTGVLMNLLNPKVSLFFIAFLPQFLNPNQAIFYQASILGLSFLIIGFLTFGSFALLADRLRVLLQSDSFLRAMKWMKIIVLLVLAIFLIIPTLPF